MIASLRSTVASCTGGFARCLHVSKPVGEMVSSLAVETTLDTHVVSCREDAGTGG